MEKNNCILGYCLGGMLASIASSLDDRINETIFMATGGHIPKILYKSKATRFSRRLFEYVLAKYMLLKLNINTNY